MFYGLHGAGHAYLSPGKAPPPISQASCPGHSPEGQAEKCINQEDVRQLLPMSLFATVGIGWDGMGWDGMAWDGAGRGGMGWDGMGWGWLGVGEVGVG